MDKGFRARLVGEKGEVEYVKEVHEMVALEYQDYIKAFESTGFENAKFLREDLWNGCRGLFVANK